MMLSTSAIKVMKTKGQQFTKTFRCQLLINISSKIYNYKLQTLYRIIDSYNHIVVRCPFQTKILHGKQQLQLDQIAQNPIQSDLPISRNRVCIISPGNLFHYFSNLIVKCLFLILSLNSVKTWCV